MTSTVEFKQTPESSSIIVDLSGLRSNPSWLAGKNIIIGSTTIGIGIIIAITAYYFTNNTEHVKPSVNQSSLALYNIAKLVDQSSKPASDCATAFTAHLETFTNCGKTVCACIRNARDIFGLYCSHYAKNIVRTIEECTEVEHTMQRCIELKC